MNKRENILLKEVQQHLSEAGISVLDGTMNRIRCRYAEKEIVLSLDNLFREIALNPENKDQAIEQYSASVRGHFSSESEVRIRYWPRIVKAQPKELNSAWTEQLIPNHLEVAFCEEREHSLSFLQPLDFHRRQKSILELKKESLSNLIQAKEKLGWMKIDSDIWGMEASNGLGSAMLLIVGTEKNLQDQWLAVPSRDQLWILSEPRHLHFFQARVRQAYQEEPYPLSDAVFQWSPIFNRFYLDCISS